MILCDTDVLIEFYKNRVHIVQELQSVGQMNLAVSVITEAELYFGALNKTELSKIQRHLTGISRIAIDMTISQQFIILMENYCLSHKLGLPDALIAATAIVCHSPLYTLNTKHFQFIPDIVLYNPVTY